MESISLGCSLQQLGGTSSLAVPAPPGSGWGQEGAVAGAGWPHLWEPSLTSMCTWGSFAVHCYHGDFSTQRWAAGKLCLMHPGWPGDLCMETFPLLVLHVLQLDLSGVSPASSSLWCLLQLKLLLSKLTSALLWVSKFMLFKYLSVPWQRADEPKLEAVRRKLTCHITEWLGLEFNVRTFLNSLQPGSCGLTE